MIKNEIIQILQELCAFETADEKSMLTEDIGLDSLGMVTLLIMLEDKFEIVLDESDMNPFDLKTVGDVIKLVQNYMESDDEQ